MKLRANVYIFLAALWCAIILVYSLRTFQHYFILYPQSDDLAASRTPLHSFASSRVPDACVDAYRLPGFVYFRADSADARYVPFYSEFHNGPELADAQYPRPAERGNLVLDDDAIEAEYMALSPRPWFAELQTYHRLLQAESEIAEGGEHKIVLNTTEQALHDEMRWLHDRRLLILGDSIDRNMINFFCQDLGLNLTMDGGPVQGPKQTTAYCHVPLLNFTLMQWHIPGMFTYRPEWWWVEDMPLVAFEERFDQIFEKYSLPLVLGPSGSSPDLVLFASGLWDDRSFREAELAEKYKDTPIASRPEIKWNSASQMHWRQLQFLNARTQKFVAKIRSLFGTDVPLMYRSLIMRKNEKANDLGVVSIDRMTRSLSAQLGIEVFDWARIAYGFSGEYFDNIHIGHGHMSRIWADMVLSYLFRSAGGIEVKGNVTVWPCDTAHNARSWERCHSYFVEPLNR
ncbi:uncharacterized protein V1518DRAFT_377254 [Limtongia smithiae]|uniref:uncharacterized protein n=1 Tax=Limtongia smithiae TaxID=1125753 RepID=UPI0034CE2AB9